MLGIICSQLLTARVKTKRTISKPWSKLVSFVMGERKEGTEMQYWIPVVVKKTWELKSLYTASVVESFVNYGLTWTTLGCESHHKLSQIKEPWLIRIILHYQHVKVRAVSHDYAEEEHNYLYLYINVFHQCLITKSRIQLPNGTLATTFTASCNSFLR